MICSFLGMLQLRVLAECHQLSFLLHARPFFSVRGHIQLSFPFWIVLTKTSWTVTLLFSILVSWFLLHDSVRKRCAFFPVSQFRYCTGGWVMLSVLISYFQVERCPGRPRFETCIIACRRYFAVRVQKCSSYKSVLRSAG